jgi:pimeloyl-ACP methyl ester carboxylesterase
LTQVVLLPGLDGTGLLFEPLIEMLPPNLEPVVVQFSNDDPVGYEGLLPSVRRALPVDAPFLLVAESFSGPLAVMLAHERPSGLLGIVLSATFVKNPLPWANILPHALVKAERALSLPDALAFTALLGEYRSPRLEGLLDRARKALTPRAVRVRLEAASHVDVTSELRECVVSVLYLRAERDVIVPRHCASAILNERPDTRVIELDAPHCLLQTRPRECAAAIAEFARDQKIAAGSRLA